MADKKLKNQMSNKQGVKSADLPPDDFPRTKNVLKNNQY